MKLYWPNAIRICDDGSEERLFTYEGAFSQAEAARQFTIWSHFYHYRLKEWWIDVYEDGVCIQKARFIRPEDWKVE